MNQFDENNKRIGYWEQFHYNGKLSSKGNFINGKLTGYWEEYYTNGKLSYKEFHI